MSRPPSNSAPIIRIPVDGAEVFATINSGVMFQAAYIKESARWKVTAEAIGQDGKPNGKPGSILVERVEECPAFAALPALLKMGATLKLKGVAQ